MFGKRLFVVPAFLIGMLIAGPAGAHDPAHDHGSAHGKNGPRGGRLVLLGDHEYQAETVLDEKHNVLTIYLLDPSAKKGVSIEASYLLINLKVDGGPRQFRLSPVSMAADPAGQSSRFVVQDKELVELLHRPDTGSHLRVSITGKSYSGKFHFSDHQH